MLRIALAVIAAYAAWSLVWVGLGHAAFALVPGALDEQQRVVSLPITLGLLVVSFACSLLSGYLSSLIARGRRAATITTAALLLLTGIGVQSAAWGSWPVWFHAVFLGAILPLNWVGAGLRRRAG